MGQHPFWRLDLQVTESCNLACPYCFTTTSDNAAADLPLQIARQAVGWALRAGEPKLHLTLWGGEPLLRLPLLRAIVDDARQQATAAGKRLTLSMPTNATLLTDEALDWIEANNVRVFLSIDGDAETQARRALRSGRSSFELAEAGLRRALQRRSKPPTVRMTVTPQNAGDLPGNVLYFARLGVRELLVYPAFDVCWSDDALARYLGAQQALARWLVEQLSDCQTPERVVSLKAWLPLLRRMRSPASQRGRRLRGCGAGASLVAVDGRGHIWPCHRFLFYARRRDDGQRFSPGHLSRAPGKTLLEDLQIEQRRGAKRCVDCDCFDLCTIGCVAVNYATSGDLQKVPPVACTLMQAQIAACQQVADALADDPRLSLYAGVSLRSTLREAAADIADQAWQLYCSKRSV